ncbi:ABC transporter substrate-binding protein [Aminobacter sp. P9b]|uniref:ABC transporter substrate-binding protein n=1 Tax=Aminobacter sp. P9b TaxID=3133697 RepID=UPI0032454560
MHAFFLAALSQSRRQLLAIVGAGAVAGMIGLGGSTALAADRDHTIIVGRSGQINTLDPLRADYNQTNAVISAVYDTLVTYDETTLIGSLATEYAYSDDARSITFTLRSDVKFHDGTALTAKDVAYTLDRLKRLGAGVGSLVSDYKSTTVTDDTHFTINLSNPNLLFLPSLSKIYILNSALVDANAGDNDGQGWLQVHDAGSGPYVVGDQSQAVVIDLFKDYWAHEEGRPQSIVFRRIDESSTLRDELRAGNIDVAFNFAARDAATIAADQALKVVPINTSYQAEVVFNTRVGPTADPKVRKALRMVYDYSGGLRGIRDGFGALANGPLPARLDCRPELPEVKRDLDAARALLAEAGASNLRLKMNFQPVFDMMKQEATLFQSNLREIGVELELEPIAFPNYLASLKDPNSIPQMMLIEDSAQVPDAGVMLVKSYKSDAIGTNRTGYANPEVDKLLDQAVATADDAKRCDLYKQVQTILHDDAVMIDMYGVYLPAAYRVDALAELKPSMLTMGIEPADFRLAKP